MEINRYTDHCQLCPRCCGADRSTGMGVCRTKETPMVARAALHMWEEPCISGEEGSGTVFFSGCNLGCVYCQNRKIAGGAVGRTVTAEQLAQMYLELQNQKANNINLVTAGHFLPDVVASVRMAKQGGLQIPIVYNTSSYEWAEAIAALQETVDIFLPDLKYLSPELAKRYSRAENYPEIAKKAIAQMVRQTGEPVFDQRGILQKGVIVRHLVLPGYVEESKRVIRYLYETYGDTVYISIMNQYTPMAGVEKQYPELGRKITQEEYDEVVDYAIDLGVENGFIQEGDTADESFIPDFL